MHRVFDDDHRPRFRLNDRTHGWDDSVPIVAYQSLWPMRFAIEAQVLAESLQSLAPQIEHVGSSAVAGLSSRPIIDIALAIAQPRRIDTFVARLRHSGYVAAEPAFADVERNFVRREGGVRTHQVLVVASGGPTWRALLEFRERLRAEPALAAAYADLKWRLAGRHPLPLPPYREAKAAFVRNVLGDGAEARVV